MAVKDRCSTAQKRNSDQIRTRAEVRAMGQWGLKRAERRADVAVLMSTDRKCHRDFLQIQ